MKISRWRLLPMKGDQWKGSFNLNSELLIDVDAIFGHKLG